MIDLEKNTIFTTLVGSRLYGIHNDDSDYDKAGVMIPTVKDLVSNTMPQFKYPDEDFTVYDIRKLFNLLLSGSPNMMDLIFAPESAIIKTTPEWELIQSNRDMFISKKCRYTFSGYAISQLRRIKTHRKYLLNPPKAKPIRSDFDLPSMSLFPTASLKSILSSVLTLIPSDKKEPFLTNLDGIYSSYVAPLLAEYLIDEERVIAYEWLGAGIKAQANSFIHAPAFIKEEFVVMAHNELKFYQANTDWTQYCEWSKNRNKKRAVLEEKFGYDTKHACHLVRLLRCGIEILETGSFSPDRRGTDAEELKFIREGGWSFDEIEEYAGNAEIILDKAYRESTLQNSPRSEEALGLCTSIIESSLLKSIGVSHV